MAKIYYSIFISITFFYQFVPAQIVNKVLISGLGGQHEIDVKSAFYLGYASYDSTQFQGEVLIYPNSLQNSFIYADQNGYDMIIRSTTGLMTGMQLAYDYPTIKLVMPSGSNSFVQTFSGDVMSSPVIITGAGIDSNVTGYKVEFYSEDPITGNNLSSFSNGYIAGQIAFLANTLLCSIDSAKYLARDNGSLGGEFDPYSGFGKIIIENILGEPFPVELSSFNANVTGNDVTLNWRTETEVDNYGFDILRMFSQNGEGNEWITIGFVYGNGNSNSPIEYEFIDMDVSSAGTYFYRLKQFDNDGSFEYSDMLTAEIDAPNTFHLSQNYPNPFNPETKIDFTLPQTETGSLKVYNILGELVNVIINNELEAGTHSVIFDASKFPSGVYIYRLETENFSTTKSMTLLK
jgi:Secretion system C-terminal sorting domain